MNGGTSQKITGVSTSFFTDWKSQDFLQPSIYATAASDIVPDFHFLVKCDKICVAKSYSERSLSSKLEVGIHQYFR